MEKIIPKFKELKVGDKFKNNYGAELTVIVVTEDLIVTANTITNSIGCYTYSKFQIMFKCMVTPPTQKELVAIKLLEEAGYEVKK